MNAKFKLFHIVFDSNSTCEHEHANSLWQHISSSIPICFFVQMWILHYSTYSASTANGLPSCTVCAIRKYKINNNCRFVIARAEHSPVRSDPQLGDHHLLLHIISALQSPVHLFRWPAKERQTKTNNNHRIILNATAKEHHSSGTSHDIQEEATSGMLLHPNGGIFEPGKVLKPISRTIIIGGFEKHTRARWSIANKICKYQYELLLFFFFNIGSIFYFMETA